MDGFRALVGRWASGGVVRIRSRHGTDMTSGFPEIAEAFAAIPTLVVDVLMDGELVVWSGGLFEFGRLGSRLGAGPALARRLAVAEPAAFVAFDLLHAGGMSLVREPYQARRMQLEKLFVEHHLSPPLNLMPSSTDPDDLAGWLGPASQFGVEGAVFKNPLCGSFRTVRCPMAKRFGLAKGRRHFVLRISS